ncbi:hypothetical protein LF817_06125 [Halobacillus sp. A1]|uniref:hypothetical protein n=1 Tax=Halobacillus sp. A1 TaxID=2880262 RepID=UPI0020A6C2DF|nr:hypothetical protein [Halobacillus sp. A1]MCP3030917.1 hypothetical protein [Halobacillus sp. A1]
MKFICFYFGLLLTGIFGGQFLVRLLRDGDFFVAEFIGGLLGVVLLITCAAIKGSFRPIDSPQD